MELLCVILEIFIFNKWSLTLREEHRLRVFENRVLGRIFGPKEGGSGRRLEKTA
jgi:hypothetical protein